ncbi:hypothetical protein CIC12_27910 [Burkholderia sp. SG-MS1]|uniref:hypothetical protein n=1 Tax=Paraburkholderia sp. SG-MS1 TaxID=2023741 RepID=UPI0014454E91|nr:hypothetical protein [Paraburkholderia sp. SG-MS1]NKJ50481.1 hypothetical protein [Paraburkholderia sp. SG-MS1]
MTTPQRWTILVASTGGALEVFDFVIFGFFARNIGNEFFPPRMGVSAMTLSFTAMSRISYTAKNTDPSPDAQTLLARLTPSDSAFSPLF